MTDEILNERKRLPVLSVAGRSYSYVWDQRRLLLPPLAVVFLIEYGFAVAAQQAQGMPASAKLLPILAIALASMVGLMPFAVGLHRAILLRDVRTGIAFLRIDGFFRGYGWACLKIFGAAILFGIVCALALVLVVFIGIPGGPARQAVAQFAPMVVALSLLLILMPRFTLALPAAALGESTSIRRAWRLTRGSWLRLVAVLTLAILPFTLLGLLLELPTLAAAAMSKLVPSMAEALNSLKYVLMGFSAALRAVSTAVLTVTLSLSYAALTRPPEFQEA